jgi:cell division septation protein DedD
MFESFAEKEHEEDRPRQDRELTLGPATLLGVVGGLVLLCGVSFGLGYSVGRRSAPSAAAIVTQSASGQTITAPPGAQLDKPDAKGTIPSTPPAQPSYPQSSQSLTGGGTAAAANPLTSYAPAASTAEPAAVPSQVRPVLPAQTGQPQTGSSTGAAEQVQPAAAQPEGLVVQVAAVSRVEDANVLMTALRKRGYAAVARRGTSDSLIHIQVGPFANRADADAVSQRLLGDGYNATLLQ